MLNDRRQSVSPSSSSKPTIYIVDDDDAMRKSLCWLVETLGLTVRAFPSAETFLAHYDEQKCGCLVVDLKMPGMSGSDLQRELRSRDNQIPVIVLTGYGSVPAVVEALKQGATEFLEKPFDDKVLLDAIQRALALDAQRRSESHEQQLIRDRMKRLTPREQEVLSLVVEGMSSREIASRLSVSCKTVEAHRAKIMQKMATVSIADLVRTVVSARVIADRNQRR